MPMANNPEVAPNIEELTRCPMDQFYSDLRTSPKGLSASEAERRYSEHGANVLPEAKKVSFSKKAVVQFKNLFNVLLIIAAILSFVTGISSNDMSSIQMGFAILLVVVLSVLFSLFQEYRAERAIEALHRLVPENIKVMRDGKVIHLTASRIVPGDVIELEEGDKVPADGRLLNAFELSIDNSILTGESEPQIRTVNCPNQGECPATDRTNLVLAGTTITSGSGTAIIFATGGHTQFGHVVEITHAIEEPLSPLQREINLTARLNFIVAIAVGFIFLLIAWQFLHLPLSDSLLFMIGVMVCVVPEGLQITLTLSLALSSLAMSKKNVVVKRLSSVETLGSTTVICTDKTGTITEGQMTVRKIWMGGQAFDVTGEGYEPDGKIFLNGQDLKMGDRKDLRTICEVAALDNRATLVPPLDRRKYRWTAVGDSTDAALLVMAAKAGLDLKKESEEQPRIGMIPFESIRKMMTSVHQRTDGTITAYVKGAGNEILSRCGTALWGDQVVPMTPQLANEIRTQIDGFAREAYRVIALAVRELPAKSERYESAAVESELTFVGLTAILDPPRRDVARAVSMARSAGIRIVMLTGDHELTAEAIARKVGIITSEDHIVLSCERLAERTDEELSKMLDTPELVFARVTPEQKLRIVHILQTKGETVAVTGDGVNDAPALLEADIGIAMGITGTDVARESADMVLLDDNFASIVSGVEVGRSVFDNLRKFIVYVFSHNWAELMTFIVFVLLQTPLPLAVVGVLAIDLMLEIAPSISLTMEQPEPGTMDRPPRSRKSHLFDARTLARSGYIGTIIGLVAVFWCFTVWSQAGWALGASTMADRTGYLKGMTIVLVGIMAGQLGTFFAVRTSVKSSFSMSLFGNRWLLPSLAVEFLILLAIVYVPFIQPIFGSVGLEPIQWLLLFAIAPVILAVEEVRKYVSRRIIVPAPTITIASPIQLAPIEKAPQVVKEIGYRAPFVETGPPLVMMGFSESGIRNALSVAMGLAEQSKSRILIVSDQELIKSHPDILTSEPGIPCEFVGLSPSEGPKGKRAAARTVKKYANRRGVETIVVAVEQKTFSGRISRKAFGWVKELAGKSVILVSVPTKKSPVPHQSGRLLIPILEDSSLEVLELAKNLTSSSIIPDVDVVAAKIIKMPQGRLFSTYRPESLSLAEEEFEFQEAMHGLNLIKKLTPRVLFVRDISREVIRFAEERRADMIILQGYWTASRHGFLAKSEMKIAANAHCSVAVLLSSAPEMKTK
jgi:Ca2+-transporting ATPase